MTASSRDAALPDAPLLGVPVKHIVVLVHGTWDAPRDGGRHWTRVDGLAPKTFATVLQEGIQTRLGHDPSVQIEVTSFTWPGRNDHQERSGAADSLAREVMRLTGSAPNAHVHLVGHSHGGNVALLAYERYLESLHSSSWASCCEVFRALGTTRVSVDDAIHRALLDGGFAGALHCPVFGVPALTRDLEAAFKSHPTLVDSFTETLDATREMHVLDDGSALQSYKEPDPPPASRSRDGHFSTFYKAWLARTYRCPAMNRVRSISFLGTPFLVRHHHQGGKRHWRWLWRLSLSFVAIGVLLYALLMGAAVLLSAMSPAWSATDALSPWRWPPPLHVVALVACAALALASDRSDPRDLNLYFPRAFPFCHEDGPERPGVPLGITPALVITSPQRDEALLALGSEPVLRAIVGPRLRRLFRPPFRRHRKTVLSHERARPYARWEELGRTAAAFVRALGARVLHPALRALETWMTNALMQAVYEALLGIPHEEFESSSVLVATNPAVPYLRLTTFFPHATASPLHAPPRRDAATFSPATDEAAFWASVERWAQRRGDWATVPRGTSLAELRVRIQATQARLGELLGAIRFEHSHYHARQDVLDTLADFIAGVITSPRPADAPDSRLRVPPSRP